MSLNKQDPFFRICIMVDFVLRQSAKVQNAIRAGAASYSLVLGLSLWSSAAHHRPRPGTVVMVGSSSGSDGTGANGVDHPQGEHVAEPAPKDENPRPPKIRKTTKTSADRRRRWSTLQPVDISIKHDTERVRNQDVSIADLPTFDMYVDELKAANARPATAPPFEPLVWDHIREAFGHAHPVGFTPPQEPDTFHVKTMEESLGFIRNCDYFRWLLMPVQPKVVAEKTGLPLNTVLSELLYASSIGMMDVVWSAECTNCGTLRRI